MDTLFSIAYKPYKFHYGKSRIKYTTETPQCSCFNFLIRKLIQVRLIMENSGRMNGSVSKCEKVK